jgi:hypothetical protein
MPPCFLVATKIDQISLENHRQISLEKCLALSEKIDARYLEISSRLGNNIGIVQLFPLSSFLFPLSSFLFPLRPPAAMM